MEPSLAGPKRPQDRVALAQMKEAFRKALTAPVKERGFGLAAEDLSAAAPVEVRGDKAELGHGAVVIAAITSCTNTSNPSVMLGAGLLARKAVARGLKVPGYVKTSLAPGSKVVTEYLRPGRAHRRTSTPSASTSWATAAPPASATAARCPPAVSKAVNDGKLVASAVLSGNRNFEGRINPDVKANYLASPPLVVAYALAGTTDIDLTTEPLGTDRDGKPVMLSEIWPTQKEVAEAEARIGAEMFASQLRQRLRRQPDLERDPGGRGRPVRLPGRLHLHPGPALLPGPDPGARAHPRHRGRARPGDPRRLGHHRPHLARRRHRARRARPAAS